MITFEHSNIKSIIDGGSFRAVLTISAYCDVISRLLASRLHIGDLIMLTMYTYDPEAIVLGGSIAQAFEFFKDSMYEQLGRFPYDKSVERIHISCCTIDNVGVLGASTCG